MTLFSHFSDMVPSHVSSASSNILIASSSPTFTWNISWLLFWWLNPSMDLCCTCFFTHDFKTLLATSFLFSHNDDDHPPDHHHYGHHSCVIFTDRKTRITERGRSQEYEQSGGRRDMETETDSRWWRRLQQRSRWRKQWEKYGISRRLCILLSLCDGSIGWCHEWDSLWWVLWSLEVCRRWSRRS